MGFFIGRQKISTKNTITIKKGKPDRKTPELLQNTQQLNNASKTKQYREETKKQTQWRISSSFKRSQTKTYNIYMDP